MRKFLYGALSATLVLSPISSVLAAEQTTVSSQAEIATEETTITLSDEKILVDGTAAKTNTKQAVYTSHDIIYYEDKDTYTSGNPYGEGTDEDKHAKEEADKHTVVNITKPGTYRISGKLSYGQIFVNVGEEETDQVTLILDNVDINCTVAPAVLFYNVYECDADRTTETATYTVDTSKAGARVIIADDSTNTVVGSYVARIYKDNAEQKKLHKYDAAFYSRMSMEIDGETKGNGVLNITAENEGLDTERHLTINGGKINIQSGDDGINVNEDGISVFTMNDGYLNIYAGNGAEGDGIDSNGWNVINGGTVISLANPNSPDGGIDSDMGSFINGGTVIGAGNMYDPLEDNSKQLFMSLQLTKSTDQLLAVLQENDQTEFAYDFPHDYTYISFSTPSLKEGTYQVYQGGTITGTQENGYYATITSYLKGTQLHHGGNSTPFSPNGERPEGMQNGEMPALPEDMQNGERPELPADMQNGERPELPEGMQNGERPELPADMQNGEVPTPPEGAQNGNMMGKPFSMISSSNSESYDFILNQTSKSFTNISGSQVNDETTSSTTQTES
ncbi:MAG: carbohydrate-binding domain-containing protein [Cellulosilyticum sp.]|nr:carbohydrate-binding domain-containing protein [Cellulosilyticum sp.]